MHVYVSTCMYICVHMHVYVSTCMYMCVHMYVFMLTHVHACTHAFSWGIYNTYTMDLCPIKLDHIVAPELLEVWNLIYDGLDGSRVLLLNVNLEGGDESSPQVQYTFVGRGLYIPVWLHLFLPLWDSDIRRPCQSYPHLKQKKKIFLTPEYHMAAPHQGNIILYSHHETSGHTQTTCGGG